MTDTSRKATLELLSYIQYLVQIYQKNKKDKNKDIRALIDSGSKINAMHSAYAMKLGLRARKIDVNVQKINRSHLDIFRIVIADCSVRDKLGRVWFFQETFLLANIGLKIDLGMPFITFSKANIRFAERKLVLRTYMGAKMLPTTRRVEIIDKSEFVVAVLNTNDKIFMMHIVALAKLTSMPIHSFCQVQVALLTSKETRDLVEYSNFSNIFSSNSAAELPDYTRINNHLINLQDNKQPPYSLI